MPYPWAVGDVLHATDLNSAIAAAAAGAGPGLPIAGIAGYLFGLTLSNDVGTPDTVLDIAAGACADSTGTVMITLGDFTKSTAGAWAAGSGQNGMGAGLTLANSTWYHVFACINAGVSDIFFDTGAAGIHALIGTTALRRIGSFKAGSAGAIWKFAQHGDRFDLGTPVSEYNGTPGVTTGVLLTLVAVPTGVIVTARLSGNMSDLTTPNTIAYLSSPTQTDIIAVGGGVAITVTTGTISGGPTTYLAEVDTDTSQRIRRRVNSTTAVLNIVTNGWIDQRGRF